MCKLSHVGIQIFTELSGPICFIKFVTLQNVNTKRKVRGRSESPNNDRKEI